MKVLIFGKFNILHPGHIFLISHAKQRGEVTAVLESDKHIKKFHNFEPYYDQVERVSQLKKYNINVCVREENDFDKIIIKEKSDLLLFGYDQDYIYKEFKAIQSKYNFSIEKLEDFRSYLFKSSRLRSILEDKSAAVYLIDKNKGAQSFKAVAALRKILDMKKIGFSGTLDPLASGLLILASGKATRLLDWFHFLPKIYQADIIFGQTSASYDLETEIIQNKNAKVFDEKYLLENLQTFVGKQVQQAPIFSAKKVDGKRLYKAARLGKDVTAPSKEIEIYNIKLDEFDYPKAKITVSVSAGTYIRSLVHDLGQKTSQGAVMSDLRRTAIGDFRLNQSISLDNIDKQELLAKSIKPKDLIESLNQWFYQSQIW